jgi:P4 family phage/plasmid primase-like protien
MTSWVEYTLQDFPQDSLVKVDRIEDVVKFDSDTLPSDFDRRLQTKHPKLWNRIRTEGSALDADAPIRDGRSGKVDRSSNDQYIACEMLRNKYTEGQVYEVLTHETWFSGSKYRDNRYNEAYVLQTIAYAQKHVSEEPITQPATLSEKLREDWSVFYWQGNCYVYDESGVYRRGDLILRQAIQTLASEKWRPEVQSSTLMHIQNETEIDKLPEPELINVKNGMLRISTGELEEHKRAYRSITQYNASWDPDVDTREVDQFVSRILPEDTIDLWWMFSGYCLDFSQPSFRIILLLIGEKRTGKSTLLDALGLFLGWENVSSVPLSDLTGQGNQFTLSAMVGKALNIDDDVDHAILVRSTNKLKSLSSGGHVQIEQKGKQPYSDVLPVKLAFAMNDAPGVVSLDGALLDRMRWIRVGEGRKRFEIDNDETKTRMSHLIMSSEQNRSAWLKRSVEGLQRLNAQGGFPETTSSAKEKAAFRNSSNNVEAFWNECTKPTSDPKWVPIGRFYPIYQQWIAETGAKYKEDKAKFSRMTKEIVTSGGILARYKSGDSAMIAGREITTFTVKGSENGYYARS